MRRSTLAIMPVHVTPPVVAIVGSVDPTRVYEPPLRVVERAGSACEELGRELAKAGCRTFFVADLTEGRRVRDISPEATVYVLNGLMSMGPDAWTPESITLADSLFQYAPVAGAHLLSDPAAIKQTLAAGGPAK